MTKFLTTFTLILALCVSMVAAPTEARPRKGNRARSQMRQTSKRPHMSLPRPNQRRAAPTMSLPRPAPRRQIRAPRQVRAPRQQYRAPRRQMRAPRQQYRAPRRQMRAPRQQYRAPRRQMRAPRQQYRAPRQNRAPRQQYRAPRQARNFNWNNNNSRQMTLPTPQRQNRFQNRHQIPTPNRANMANQMPRRGNRVQGMPGQRGRRGMANGNRGNRGNRGNHWMNHNGNQGMANRGRRGNRGNRGFQNAVRMPIPGTAPRQGRRVRHGVPNGGHHHYASQPHRGHRVHQPVVVNNHYNYTQPYIYSDYGYRRRCRRSLGPLFFLSLGYYAVRPYSSYYYRTGYDVPLIYGDDSYYRSAPAEVAATIPTPPPSDVPQVAPTPIPSTEEGVLKSLNLFVAGRSKDDAFQIVDPALDNKTWSLDLSQAPAVYSIDENHYSVVAGFEGTLDGHPLPSSVGVEFFVVREGAEWVVKNAWIVSANGIVREKRFQSPAFPQVKTWQEGALCPFSGQPMVPVQKVDPIGKATDPLPVLSAPTL